MMDLASSPVTPYGGKERRKMSDQPRALKIAIVLCLAIDGDAPRPGQGLVSAESPSPGTRT